jgi:hypothetical protein
MALLISVLSTVLLMGLGVSLVLLGSSETMLAGHHRDATAAAYASRAASAIATADLRALPSWSGVLTSGAAPEVCATPGRFIESTLSPTAPWGGAVIDLRALTSRLQADTDANTVAGTPAIIWRLFESGPLPRLIGDSIRRPPYYLVVWAADGHGVILIRSAALGPGETKAVTEASVTRDAAASPPGPLHVLSVRRIP